MAQVENGVKASATRTDLTRWHNAAIYVRVSKGEQTVEQQIAVLEPWVAPQSDQYEIIKEKGSTRRFRTEIESLRRRIMAGEFDAIVVWKIDRLGRNADELHRWKNECLALGCALVSFTEAIDLSTPEGRLHFGIIVLFAEYERDVTSSRIKRKLDHLRTQGVVPNNGNVYNEELARKLAGTLSDRAYAEALGVSKSTATRVRRRLAAEKDPRKRLLLTPEQQEIERLRGLLRRHGVAHDYPNTVPSGE